MRGPDQDLSDLTIYEAGAQRVKLVLLRSETKKSYEVILNTIPYMWYLIVNEQIARSRNHVNKTMTMDQLLEAEQRAAEWMKKTKKIPPVSIEDPSDHQPKSETDASTA